MMTALIYEMQKAGLLPGNKSADAETDSPEAPSEITCSGEIRLPIGGIA